MRGRVTLGGGLPYLLARVTLLEGTTFCLFNPLHAYKPGELFRRPMLARLNQKDEEESNISLEAGIDHSGEIVLVKGEGLDLKDSPHGVSHWKI